MVNVGLNPGALLGIILFGAGAGLYFMRSVRPELARDHDIFFMAVAILSGGILFFQGWRLDPILTFGQFLLTGSAIFFAVESIRLRGLATSQAKRNTPIVDYDRPISRVYKAEFDEEELSEEPQISRRMIGTRDGRSTDVDEYEEDLPRRTTPRRSSSRTRPQGSSARRTTPSRRTPTRDRSFRERDDWETPSYGDSYPRRSSDNGATTTRDDRPTGSSSRPRRSRPPGPSESAGPRNYVDFQPIDSREDEEDDNSRNFDY